MQRIRELGLLQALIEGREAVVERSLRPKMAPAGEEWERPKRVETPPPPPVPAPAPPVPSVRALLASRRALRQAMILQEILGPPVSLRSP